MKKLNEIFPLDLSSSDDNQKYGKKILSNSIIKMNKTVTPLLMLLVSNMAFSLTPQLNSVNPACGNKYCVKAKGTDFDTNASVYIREDIAGSKAQVFTGNDLYWKTFTSTEDKFTIPIQSLSLQSKWENNGLCIKISNNGQLSNELCMVKNVFPVQPKFMGETIESYNSAQDVENTSWIIKGNASGLEGGDLLKIMGNSWKQIAYNYMVSPDTILKFDFLSNRQQAEINGVGLIFTNGVIKHFQVNGTQNWGIQDYHNYSGTDYKSYIIPVGEHYTGKVAKMFFTADEDNHVGQNIVYKAPRLEEMKKIIDVDSVDRVANRYMISYNDDALSALSSKNKSTSNEQLLASVANNLAQSSGSQVVHIYSGSVYGSTLYNLNQSAIEQLFLDPLVEDIYADTVIQSSTSVQTNPPWGLDRIDQVSKNLDNQYHYNSDGTGINVFVLDTGIMDDHPEFGGRVLTEFDFHTSGVGIGCSGNNKGGGEFNDPTDPPTHCNGLGDGHGHGTHVAGIIGGETYGVAKNVNLHSIRVLGSTGGGSVSDLINALDWLYDEICVPELGNPDWTSNSVINMSLWVGGNPFALKQVTQPLVDCGVTLVASAGNNGEEECTKPARFDHVISVGASDSNDQLATFSDRGSCVDVYAPGVDILSADNSGLNRRRDGTSQAAPHVAGAIAILRQQEPNLTPAQITDRVIDSASNTSLKILNSLNLTNSTTTTPPDSYDDISIRGYTDDVPRDAEPFYVETTPQQHNFHDSGDQDWLIFGLGNNQGVNVITTQLENVSAGITAYRIDGEFTQVSSDPDRWDIQTNDLTLYGSDTSLNDNNVIIQNTSGETQYYVIKVESSGVFGSNSSYSIRSETNNP